MQGHKIAAGGIESGIGGKPAFGACLPPEIYDPSWISGA
jgi:hypothetical protein